MGGVIHAQEDNLGLSAGQVVGILADGLQGWPLPLRATTPHRSYTFEVVDVLFEEGQPVTLGLREVARSDGPTVMERVREAMADIGSPDMATLDEALKEMGL